MVASDPCGIGYLAGVSASVAHELRNVLAVINENAGLLEDACRLAQKGRPLDLQRVMRVATDILQQVRRGDRITSGLGRLSHSVDAGGISMDASEWVETFAALSSRTAVGRGVSLQVGDCGPGLTVRSGLGLLQLMSECLDFATSAVGPGKRVELSAEGSAGGVCFRFSGLDALRSGLQGTGAFPAERHIALCRSAGANITTHPDAGEVRLEVAKVQDP